MFFDPERLLKRIKDLSYPRLVGTGGGKQVLADIALMLRNEGYSSKSIQEHECVISRLFGKWFVSVITGTIAALFAGLLCARLFDNKIFALVLLFLFIIASIVFYRKRNGLHWKSDPVTTKNIYTVISAGQTKKGTILLGCHLDSKGQLYPLFMRVVLFIIAVLFGIVFLSLNITGTITLLVNNQLNSYIRTIEQTSGWLSFLSLILLSFNVVNNNSRGAADNASGLTIVMELAGYFKSTNGLSSYELVFAFFNAEELGVLGSAKWIDDFGKSYVPGKSYMINFDMVGKEPIMYMSSSGLLKKPANNNLNVMLKKAAHQLNVSLAGFWMPIGAMTDSIPFRKAGWEACDIISPELARVAHTKKDVPENINGKALADICVLVKECIEGIDRGDI